MLCPSSLSLWLSGSVLAAGRRTMADRAGNIISLKDKHDE